MLEFLALNNDAINHEPVRMRITIGMHVVDMEGA
jgi:hypothetical protein